MGGRWPPDITKFPRVSAMALRDMFNRSGLDDQVKSGEVVEILVENNHPSAPVADEPFCTRSQMVEYRKRSSWEALALFHRYLRVDGTIGASGLRDPKALRVGTLVYMLEDASPRRI